MRMTKTKFHAPVALIEFLVVFFKKLSTSI